MRDRVTWDLNELEEVIERLLPLFALFKTEFSHFSEVQDFYPDESLHYRIQKNMWGDYPTTGFYEFMIDEWKHEVHRLLFVNKKIEGDTIPRDYDVIERGGYYFLFQTRRSRARMFAGMRR